MPNAAEQPRGENDRTGGGGLLVSVVVPDCEEIGAQTA